MIGHIERLYRCMLYAFGRGRIKFVDDTGPVQRAQIQIFGDEIIDGLPVPHDYGFTSNPPVDSDVVAAFMGGNRKNGVIVAVGSQQYRIKNLKSGEVAIYDGIGQSILLTKTGIVINGNATLNGTLTVTQDVVVNGKSFNNHRHGGVAIGGSNTGTPV
jgi:phage gp45-like